MGNMMDITPEQHKLLASALRMKILHVLSGDAKTSKQVADLLGESPGNVHYHIQRLFDGGLLELVDTREVSGIVEKYYKSVSTRFHVNDPIQPSGERLNLVTAHLLLTEAELRELNEQLMDLLERWESKPLDNTGTPRREIMIDVSGYVRAGDTKKHLE